MKSDKILDLYVKIIVAFEILIQFAVNEFHLYIFSLSALIIVSLLMGVNRRIGWILSDFTLMENKILLEKLLFSVEIIRLSRCYMTHRQNSDTNSPIKQFPHLSLSPMLSA
jgi:hypothetical protein